jgi:hypothetical protein
MQFLLTGFRDDVGVRVFTFQGVAADKTKSPVLVRADIGLIRKYGIRVQELPLLCRGILELRNEGELVHAVIFTEEDMRLHSVHAAEEKEAAARKKPRRQPAAEETPSEAQPAYIPWTAR